MEEDTLCNYCLRGILGNSPLAFLPQTADRHPSHLLLRRGTQWVWTHHQTVLDLQNLAKLCALCSHIWEHMCAGLENADDTQTQMVAAERAYLYISKLGKKYLSGSPSQSFYEILRGDGHGPGIRLAVWPDVQFLAEKYQESGKEAIWTDTSPITLDDRWPVIQKWIDACELDHHRCRESRKRGPLPARLIALGHDALSLPRLVATEHLDGNAITYTTLSHRWGTGVKPLCTLSNNLEEHYKLLPCDQIPKTFLDAMRITRKLGIAYIWIDSLCIVQDSEIDWQHQAAKMKDVYESSYLNIAAVDSGDANGSCFLDSLEERIRFRAPHNGEYLNIRIPCATDQSVAESPLLKRGWVFQELILSPRVLYCKKTQFFWQCHRGSFSEDGVVQDTKLAINYPPRHSSKHYPAKDNLSDWLQLMEAYKQLEFTKEEDRTPAMAGITRWYQAQHNLTPVLGLWKELMAKGLNWHCSRPFTSQIKPFIKPLNIPTWSWLGVEPTGVRFHFHTRDIDCLSIVKASTEWNGEELTSDLISSQLIVLGFLFELRFDFDRGASSASSWFVKSTDLDYLRDDYDLSDSDISGSVEVRFDRGQPEKANPVCTCLLLSMRNVGPESSLEFLMLNPVQCDKGQRPKYRRFCHGTWKHRNRTKLHQNISSLEATSERFFRCELIEDSARPQLTAHEKMLRRKPIEIELC
ncbi:HET-domain-containing protein [Microthyrium microscopicum]|uniref:HET-domain-containing protein n=1 Tax=Microthyrium microscopicum TaxID=703497 RepID=A0A6A6ULF8_9PEZI|nr:HET-domain-containing protein [Microthyrium microscopicum]